MNESERRVGKMLGMPKPLRKPRSECPTCRKQFTARALLRHAKGCGRPNKYGAKRTVTAGGAFPSKLEANTYTHLMALKAAGYYAAVVRYDTVELIPGVKWKVDFVCSFPNGELEWVEAKGIEGERYRVIVQLWRELGPGRLVVYKADRRGNPVISETIVPKRKQTKENE